MGRGGVETKVNKGTCYWVWNPCDKILPCMKKDPSCFRKHLEQCFLRPDLKNFLEFQKNFWFAISLNLKMTIQNYFFVKNVCKKKSPIKFVGNFLTQKEHIRAHPNEYEIYVEKYFLVWKKTRVATANNRNNVLWGLIKKISEILKKIQFATNIALKVTIQNYFFVKKVCQKNLTTEMVKKVVKIKNWKSTFFYKKI